MWSFKATEVTSFYGADFKPSSKQVAIREEKVKEVIRGMGDKYLLAKPIVKKQVNIQGENHGS